MSKTTPFNNQPISLYVCMEYICYILSCILLLVGGHLFFILRLIGHNELKYHKITSRWNEQLHLLLIRSTGYLGVDFLIY